MINSTIKILDKYFLNISPIYKEINSWNNINRETFNNWKERSIIDSFVFNFIKIQDMMGDKLFKYVLNIVGEYKRSMSFIDIINKLEKLELIESSYNWRNYRNLRNNLTHDYPDNYKEIIKNLKKSLNSFKEIESIYQKIKNYIKKYET